MEFWAARHLTHEDPLNETIWVDSPLLQHTIQAPELLAAVGSVGAQQAMVPGDSSRVLPWVPDLVGNRWREADALLIVGSAYAGFIAECSGRSHALPLAHYVGSSNWHDFQRRFLSAVVERDPNYYGPLASLIRNALNVEDASRAAVFDLCRASFVQRGAGEGQRVDKSGDGVVKLTPQTYASYVETPIAADWIWARLTGGLGRRLIALGTIAEHGLLRLFAKRGCEIRHSITGHLWTAPRNRAWPLCYADAAHKLQAWFDRPSWWTVHGGGRSWSVLPVRHPARSQGDPQYLRAAAVLSLM